MTKTTKTILWVAGIAAAGWAVLKMYDSNLNTNARTYATVAPGNGVLLPSGVWHDFQSGDYFMKGELYNNMNIKY
jgi:hypothetical protein